MASNIQVRDKRFIINSWAQDLLKLSGLDHRSFIPKVVLNDHIAFGKFENKITEFYFSSNQGSCSSQVKKLLTTFDFGIILISFFRLLKSGINRPMMHFLCGSKIDDLLVFSSTSDYKNYHSKCKLNYGATFYSPKNSSEALEIFRKYREGT